MRQGGVRVRVRVIACLPRLVGLVRFLRVEARVLALGVPLAQEGGGVHREEGGLLEELHLARVEPVLAAHELHDRAWSGLRVRARVRVRVTVRVRVKVRVRA